MPHAVRIHRYGGPEVLSFDEVPVASPGPGEVLLRQHAVGGCGRVDIVRPPLARPPTRRAARAKRASIETSMPGASTPPTYSPAGETTSKFVDVPKSTTITGAP